jgi:uncharacterized protein
MANFSPVTAAIGGALIGLAATLLMLINGKTAGVSGILASCLDLSGHDRAGSAAFIAGLILAPIASGLVGFAMSTPQMPSSWTVIVVAGVLVGFGTRLGSGCTSGHGVCGLARLSPRSIVATTIFMTAAIIVVGFSRHVFGG